MLFLVSFVYEVFDWLWQWIICFVLNISYWILFSIKFSFYYSVFNLARIKSSKFGFFLKKNHQNSSILFYIPVHVTLSIVKLLLSCVLYSKEKLYILTLYRLATTLISLAVNISSSVSNMAKFKLQYLYILKNNL